MKTCIIVEDANFMVDLYKFLLKDLPIKFVAEASDGVKAFELIRSQKPDIVLLDLILPLKSGFDILSECANLPTQFVAISSLNDPDLQKRAMELGAIYFIEKPFKKNELVQCFEFLINQNQDGVRHG